MVHPQTVQDLLEEIMVDNSMVMPVHLVEDTLTVVALVAGVEEETNRLVATLQVREVAGVVAGAHNTPITSF